MQLDSKVLLLGDVHGRADVIEVAARRATSRDIKTIIQIGDYWAYESATGTAVESVLSSLGVQLFFIPGNHEHFGVLDYMEEKPHEPTVITPHVTYLPKLTKINIGERRTLCLGGAVSIDRDSRLPGADWFPQEVISHDEMLTAQTMGQFDIVLAHDCPANVNMPPGCLLPTSVAESWFGAGPLIASNEHRKTLELALCNTDYALLVHGHYHQGYTTVADGAAVTGLGMELDRDSMAVLDTSNGIDLTFI